MSMITVCNALNTSEYDEINYMNCLDYWISKKCREISLCCACGKPATLDDPLVGGHVMTLQEKPQRVYIVPMHDSCNKSKGNLPPFNVDVEYLVEVPTEQEKEILSDIENVKETSRKRLENTMRLVSKIIKS